MSPCPHCHYMFDGWFPLKEHLLTDVYCSILERDEMDKIRKRKKFIARMSKKVAEVTDEEVTYETAPGLMIDEALEIRYWMPVNDEKMVDLGTLAGRLPLRDLFYVREIDTTIAPWTVSLRTRLVEHVAAHIFTNYRDVLDMSLKELFEYLNDKNIVLFDTPRETMKLFPYKQETVKAVTLLETEESTKIICNIVRDYMACATGLHPKTLPIKVEFQFRLSNDDKSKLRELVRKRDREYEERHLAKRVTDDDIKHHGPNDDVFTELTMCRNEIELNTKKLEKYGERGTYAYQSSKKPKIYDETRAEIMKAHDEIAINKKRVCMLEDSIEKGIATFDRNSDAAKKYFEKYVCKDYPPNENPHAN